MKSKDSIYFLQIKIDHSFIKFLADPKLANSSNIATRMIFLTRNKNFINLILTELQERRLKKSLEFRKKKGTATNT